MFYSFPHDKAIALRPAFMKGIYQHCDEQHLQRYLAEVDFRYSNRTALKVDDFERTIRALAGISGKRLTYKQGANLAS